MHNRKPAVALLAVLAPVAVLAACGDDDTSAASTGETTETTSAAVETADAPERIVSLSPSATEMLFAIGAGDQVVAVDDQSDFPAGVPTTDLSAYEPNVEAVAAYEPDLVVISDQPAEIVDGLESLGGQVLVLPDATVLDDTYAQIEQLGEVTGHEEEADELVAAMQADIDEILATVPDREAAPTYYHELDSTLYSVTSSTFIGQLYSLAGLENVADPAGADDTQYPQMSAEFLVDADPDFIFLADTECCGENAETVAARPGFADLTAIREGRVVELSDDIASRWGPRVVDFLRLIVDATASVPALS